MLLAKPLDSGEWHTLLDNNDNLKEVFFWLYTANSVQKGTTLRNILVKSHHRPTPVQLTYFDLVQILEELQENNVVPRITGPQVTKCGHPHCLCCDAIIECMSFTSSREVLSSCSCLLGHKPVQILLFSCKQTGNVACIRNAMYCTTYARTTTPYLFNFSPKIRP